MLHFSEEADPNYSMNRILVVEDDPDLSQNIRESLKAEQLEGVPVFDGLLAYRILDREEFDCVIMDVNLPGWDGFRLCREFRKLNQHTPVIMLTAFSELEDKVMGYEAGADDYLAKPFYMKELMLKIQALLKRSLVSADGSAGFSQLLVSGGLEVDLQKKSVVQDGLEINLTPREFQVLAKLLQAKGNIVSKKELVQEIWGSAFDLSSSTNTIEVYINFLRNKLDKPFGKTNVRTKVGFGYYYLAEGEH